MTGRVVFSEEARADLREILSYVLDNDGMARAETLIDALQSRAATLSTHPNRGQIVKELHGATMAVYRQVHCKPYRIIYEVVGPQVIIHAVLDGRRDMEQLLRERLLR